jgi:hypothetical protein
MAACRRRLRTVADALKAAAAAAAAEEQQPLFPLPLTEEGAVLQESLEQLEARKLAAADAEDYHEAALLKQVQRSFTPNAAAPSLPSGASDAERLAFMQQHGFCMIEGCFEGPQLERLCAAWRRVQQPIKAQWEAAKAEGEGVSGHGFANAAALVEKYGPTFQHRLFVDIPVETFFSEALEPGGDDVLLDLIDPPKLTTLLVDYLGADVRLCGVQPRTYSSDRQLDPDADGYTSWHRDGSTPDGYEGPSVYAVSATNQPVFDV